jgi:nucleoside-diphosphate-sugar epimerase
MSHKILITGASGFVGQNLTNYLLRSGWSVMASSRKTGMPDLSDPHADWRFLLSQVKTVVHVAGLAHVDVNSPLHNTINNLAVGRLARQAKASGIEHFVFVSSVAAQIGSSSSAVIRETDIPKPTTEYGKAKLAAEAAVKASGIDFTILRPTAIYGPGALGNLAIIEKLAKLRCPLPFGLLRGERSMISIDNFCSGVSAILKNTASRNQLYLMADPSQVSVPEIITEYRNSLGRGPMLFNVPPTIIRGVLSVFGKKTIWSRIGESLIVDSTQLRSIGWIPKQRAKFSVKEM